MVESNVEPKWHVQTINLVSKRESYLHSRKYLIELSFVVYSTFFLLVVVVVVLLVVSMFFFSFFFGAVVDGGTFIT